MERVITWVFKAHLWSQLVFNLNCIGSAYFFLIISQTRESNFVAENNIKQNIYHVRGKIKLALKGTGFVQRSSCPHCSSLVSVIPISNVNIDIWDQSECPGFRKATKSVDIALQNCDLSPVQCEAALFSLKLNTLSIWSRCVDP